MTPREKLALVAESAEAVARDIEDGSTTPGIGHVFRRRDAESVLEPCCAFGHVLDAAGFTPKMAWGSNPRALCAFLGVDEFALAWSPQLRQLEAAATKIAEINDSMDKRVRAGADETYRIELGGALREFAAECRAILNDETASATLVERRA